MNSDFEILKELNDSPVGGHLGYEKTLQKVQGFFRWYGMHGDVKKYIRECHTCQTCKYETCPPPRLLQPLPIPSKVWADIVTDFIDALPPSQGFSVIMVMIDRLSKAAHFIPLKHPYTASSVL